MSDKGKPYFVHPSSVVDEGASVGEGTRIWHFCHVMGGAAIGRDCTLGQNVFVGAKAVVGNGVKIQNNVSVYDNVTLEDDVFCGPSVVFTNVFNPRSQISRKHEYRSTRIGQGATLGANATVVCGNTVGRYAFVGCGAVVTRDVGDYALVYGNPARQAGWVCRCGVKLPGRPDELACPECGDRYKLVERRLRPA